MFPLVHHISSAQGHTRNRRVPQNYTVSGRRFLPASFHFWRKREVNQLSLPPNSKIVIGEWLNELAFPTLGIKRVAADDETEILFERRFAFDQAIASHIITELQGIGDIEVEAIRLNASFQQIKWSPKPGKVSSVRGSLFLLSFAGYPAGMICLNYVGMICAGFVCLFNFRNNNLSGEIFNAEQKGRG